MRRVPAAALVGVHDVASSTSVTARTSRSVPTLDHGQYGWSAGYRIYQCLDAWICVTCVSDPQFAALGRRRRAAGASGRRSDADDVSASPPT